MRPVFFINAVGNILPDNPNTPLANILSEDNVIEPIGRESDDLVDFYELVHNSDMIDDNGSVIDYFFDTTSTMNATSAPDGSRAINSLDMGQYIRSGSSWILEQQRGKYVIPSGNQDLDLPYYFLINAGKPHTLTKIAGIFVEKPYGENIATCPISLSFGSTYAEAKEKTGTVVNWSPSVGYNELIVNTTFTWILIEANSGNTFVNRNFMPMAMKLAVTPLDGNPLTEDEIWGTLNQNPATTFEEFLAHNHRRKADGTENVYPNDHFRVSKYQRVFAFGDLNIFSTGQFAVLSKSGSNWNVDINPATNPDAVNLGFNETEKFGFNPTPEGGINFDSDLQERSLGGTGNNQIMVVLNRCFPHYNLTGTSGSVYEFNLPWDDGTPIVNGKQYDRTKAKTWAKACFMWAARYGNSTAANDAWISPFLYTGNTLQKGLGYVYGIELGNETGRYWGDVPNAHADVIENAIIFNAGFDGMMGTYGPGYGIKDGDPNMKVYMPSTVELQKGYTVELIKQIILMRQEVYDANPSINLAEYPINPFSTGRVALSLHKYITNGGTQQSGTGGAHPESTNYLEELKSIVKIINAVAGYPVEVHVTEQGYDAIIAGEGSRIGVPVKPSHGDLDAVRATGDVTGTAFEGPYYKQIFNRSGYTVGSDIVFTGPQSNPTQITVNATLNDLSFITLKDRLSLSGSRYTIDSITDNGSTYTFNVTVASYDGSDATGTINLIVQGKTFYCPSAQGELLTRQALVNHAANIHRWWQFTLTDVVVPGGSAFTSTFASSGVVDRSDESKREGWYYIRTIRDRFGSFYPLHEHTVISSTGPCYMRYTNDSGEFLHISWMGTYDDSTQPVNITVFTNNATLIELTDGSITGTDTPLTITGNQVSITCKELPQFILDSGDPGIPPGNSLLSITDDVTKTTFRDETSIFDFNAGGTTRVNIVQFHGQGELSLAEAKNIGMSQGTGTGASGALSGNRKTILDWCIANDVHLHVLFPWMPDLNTGSPGAGTVPTYSAYLNALPGTSMCTGLSQGGILTGKVLDVSPQSFDKYAIVAGWFGPYDAKDFGGAQCGWWHGDSDSTVTINTNYTQEPLYKADPTMGGVFRVIYTSTGHNIWNQVYGSSTRFFQFLLQDAATISDYSGSIPD